VFLGNQSYFDGQKPLIIPHRGGSNIVPENTLHGLQMVISEGFTHFETDLRMSKDGEIFLHHDDSFNRTTDVEGKVKDFNWSEIKNINAGYEFYKNNNLSGYTTTFVRLEDALSMSKVLKFNLDLKETGLAKKVVEIVLSLNAQNRVLVSSFSPSRLDEFLLESKGQIATSGTFRENAIAKFLPIKKRNFQVQALQAPFKWKGMQIYSKKLVNFCKLNNLQLHIWTVNSINNLKICLDLGCDGIITDEPLLFREYLNSYT